MTSAHAPGRPAGRVLITGATGLIGGALARSLSGDGEAVRALVRPGPAADALRAAGIETAEGDIRDAQVVRAAIRGCSHVVHVAAQRTARGVALTDYHAVNVGGTEHVARAAAAEGVARVVYGSTLGVYGFVTGPPIDEATPVRPNTPYRRTKWLGATRLHDAAVQDGLPSVIVCISSVVGPGAWIWLSYCRLVDAGRLRLIGGGANATDVVALDDLVAGLRLALTVPGVDGQTYALGGGEDVRARDVAGLVAAALGRPVPSVGPPAGPYHLLAHVSTLAFLATGHILLFAHAREGMVSEKAVVVARARAELGYDPRNDVAIDAMVADFRDRGDLAAAPR